MNKRFEKELKNLIWEYEEKISLIDDRLKKTPKGYLSIEKKGKYTSYIHMYYDEDNKLVRKYLGKNKKKLISELAQKSYDKKAQIYLSNQLKTINNFYKNILKSKKPIIKENRKTLVKSIDSLYKEKLNEWLKIKYQRLGFGENDPLILSDRGIRVRSKSERDLANLFDSLGILYKYECPLYFDDGLKIYPDFTFLCPYTYKEIYWEHFGLMDDESYANSAIYKIERYRDKGIFEGHGLILTFETKKLVFDIGKANLLVEKYLLRND